METPTDLSAPPNCGKRLMPAVFDETVATDPEKVFISVPKTARIEDGFEDVTYRTFGNAVNRFARWLREQFGEHSEPRVVLYLGPLDLRYLIIILGAAKAGHIAFFSSHRNSLEAHLSLVDKSGCSAVLMPEDPPAIIKQILDAHPLDKIELPVVEFFMNPAPVEPVPFLLEWEDSKHKPFCILHTSGSTGIPKPVFVTYGTFACNDAHQLIPSFGGKPTLMHYLRGKRYFLALPLFHAACLTFTLGFNIFSGVTCVIPPPGPLTAEVTNQVFLHGNLDGALMAPSLIVDCYNNDEYCVNMINKLDFLSYVGGALPEEVGNPLSKRVKLMTLMGSCETALHPLEINEDPADWQYLTISPFLGHTYRYEKDGLYDLVVKRQPNLSLFQGVFSTFPEKDEYAMGDLFAPHPTRPESWVFRARTDDIIAFTTAEKLNPITMESVIAANPYVKGAVIGGAGQFQASLLIEPKVHPTNAAEEAELMKNIWPSVLQANRDCPAHGRIMKGFVIFTNPDKPMPIAGKGTVQRHAVLKLYAQEFRDLYDLMKPTIVNKEKESSTSELQTNGVAAATSGQVNGVNGHSGGLNGHVSPPDHHVNGVNGDAKSANGINGHSPVVNGTHGTVNGHVKGVNGINGHSSVPNGIHGAVNGAIYESVKETTTANTAAALPGNFDALVEAAVQKHLESAVRQVLLKLLAGGEGEEATPVTHQPPPPVVSTLPQMNGTHHQPKHSIAADPSPPSTPNGTDASLRSVIYDTLGENLIVENITDESDLFSCGLDSLQVQELLNSINAFIIKQRPESELIQAKVIYDNPTVSRIIEAVA